MMHGFCHTSIIKMMLSCQSRTFCICFIIIFVIIYPNNNCNKTMTPVNFIKPHIAQDMGTHFYAFMHPCILPLHSGWKLFLPGQVHQGVPAEQNFGFDTSNFYHRCSWVHGPQEIFFGIFERRLDTPPGRITYYGLGGTRTLLKNSEIFF